MVIKICRSVPKISGVCYKLNNVKEKLIKGANVHRLLKKQWRPWELFVRYWFRLSNVKQKTNGLPLALF